MKRIGKVSEFTQGHYYLSEGCVVIHILSEQCDIANHLWAVAYWSDPERPSHTKYYFERDQKWLDKHHVVRISTVQAEVLKSLWVY